MWWLWVPIGGALLLRAAELIAVAQQASLANDLLLDSDLYAAMAQRVSNGDLLLGSEPFAVGPLYAYLLAFFRLVFGSSNVPVFVCQQTAGLLSVALIALLARKLASPMGACLAGLAFAAYAPAVLLECKILGESWALLAALGVTYFAQRGRMAWSGVSLGLACLLRPDLVLCIAIGTLYTLRPERASAGWWRRPGELSFSRCLRWTAPAICIVGLATARNWAVASEFVPVSSQVGITFYQGNNSRAEGTFSIPADFSGDKLTQEAEARSIAERSRGKRLTAREVNSHFMSQGIDYLSADVPRALGLFSHKFAYFLANAELSGEYVVSAERCLAVPLHGALTPFGLFLAFFVIGLRRARQKDPELLAWAGLFILGGLLTALIFFASSRYRLVAAAHLAIFVGAGWDELREQWPRPLTRPVLAGALLFALSWLPARQAMRFQAASELYNLGGKQYERGDYHDAIRYYLAARQVRTKDVDVHYNLAQAYAMVGDYASAARELTTVLELKPGAADAREYLRRYRAQAAEGTPATDAAALCDL